MDILKALSTLNTGAYLIPEAVDEGIRDYTAKLPVLLNAVSKMPWATNTYMVRRRLSVPTATWSTDGAALPAAQNATYGKMTKSVKYVYARGEVTGPEQRAAGSLVNALAMEIEVQARIIAEELSQSIWDSTGTNDEIEGIVHQIQTDDSMNWNEDGSGLIDVAGESDPTLSLNMLDRLIDATDGTADILVASRRAKRKLNALLQSQQAFNDRTEVAAGFRVPTYDGLPIITDRNSENNTYIAAITRADAKLLVHQDFTYEPLAKVKDSDDFFIKGYFGFSLEGKPSLLKGFDLDGAL